jgi:GNAT superfamily N-acetyltransferase
MNFADIEAIATEGFLDPRFIVFVGHVEDQPVTTSLAAFSDGADEPCVGVWNVCTAPDFRGRGLGAAMTAHAAAAGRDAWGATTAFLQSSDMGYPVYRKMGYEEVARWQRWTPPA